MHGYCNIRITQKQEKLQKTLQRKPQKSKKQLGSWEKAERHWKKETSINLQPKQDQNLCLRVKRLRQYFRALAAASAISRYRSATTVSGKSASQIAKEEHHFIFFKRQCLCLFFLRGFCVDIEYLKKELTNCNFLGIVKYSKEIASKEIKSVQYELFKRIYHNINMLIPKSEKGTSIIITSCIKNEGKTFTATNLATIFAMNNKKVLLIGCDMRRPSLHKIFNIKNML